MDETSIFIYTDFCRLKTKKNSQKDEGYIDVKLLRLTSIVSVALISRFIQVTYAADTQLMSKESASKEETYNIDTASHWMQLSLRKQLPLYAKYYSERANPRGN